MTTTFKAYRSTTTAEFGHTVFIMSSGADNKLDCSIWLTDEEALQLASELRAAVAKGSAAADASAELTTTEAA